MARTGGERLGQSEKDGRRAAARSRRARVPVWAVRLFTASCTGDGPRGIERNAAPGQRVDDETGDASAAGADPTTPAAQAIMCGPDPLRVRPHKGADGVRGRVVGAGRPLRNCCGVA